MPAGEVCVRVHVCVSSPPQPPSRFPLLCNQISVAPFAARHAGGRRGVHTLAATHAHPRHLFSVSSHRLVAPPPQPPPSRQVRESNVMRPSPSWFKHERRDGDRKGISLVSRRQRNKEGVKLQRPNSLPHFTARRKSRRRRRRKTRDEKKA